jgi:hypothetical protein
VTGSVSGFGSGAGAGAGAKSGCASGPTPNFASTSYDTSSTGFDMDMPIGIALHTSDFSPRISLDQYKIASAKQATTGTPVRYEALRPHDSAAGSARSASVNVPGLPADRTPEVVCLDTSEYLDPGNRETDQTSSLRAVGGVTETLDTPNSRVASSLTPKSIFKAIPKAARLDPGRSYLCSAVFGKQIEVG